MELLVKAQHGGTRRIPGIRALGAAFQENVETAIDFSLPDQDGTSWRLADHLTRAPVVLVFYRGDW